MTAAPELGGSADSAELQAEIVAAMNEPFMIPGSVTQPRESSITISA